MNGSRQGPKSSQYRNSCFDLAIWWLLSHFLGPSKKRAVGSPYESILKSMYALLYGMVTNSKLEKDWKTIFRRLGFFLASLLLISLGSPADGQGGFGNFIQNLFRPIMRQIDTKLPLIFKSCDIFWMHVSCYLLICRPLNNFLRPINFGLRDIFRFGPQTNAAFRWLEIELKK